MSMGMLVPAANAPVSDAEDRAVKANYRQRREADEARPVSVYGSSKLKGEERVLAADPGNLVVRVSWLYGPGKPAFPEWIVDKACSESALALPADKLGCPTSSVDVAELLVPLLFGQSGRRAAGIFHL